MPGTVFADHLQHIQSLRFLLERFFFSFWLSLPVCLPWWIFRRGGAAEDEDSDPQATEDEKISLTAKFLLLQVFLE